MQTVGNLQRELRQLENLDMEQVVNQYRRNFIDDFGRAPAENEIMRYLMAIVDRLEAIKNELEERKPYGGMLPLKHKKHARKCTKCGK